MDSDSESEDDDNTETFAYRERRKKFNELLIRGEFDPWIDDAANRKAKGHREYWRR